MILECKFDYFSGRGANLDPISFSVHISALKRSVINIFALSRKEKGPTHAPYYVQVVQKVLLSWVQITNRGRGGTHLMYPAPTPRLFTTCPLHYLTSTEK